MSAPGPMQGSRLLLPVQRAVTRLLATHPLLAGTPVLEELPGTVITEVTRAADGLKRAVVVWPPEMLKYNLNFSGGVLFIDDLAITVEAGENPRLNEGSPVGVAALNERLALVLLLTPLAIDGVWLNQLLPDARPYRLVPHPERRVYHHLFHTSCALTLP
jgi:hypothetical protein